MAIRQLVSWVKLEGSGTRRKGPHSFTSRILNWRYCSRCGLIALRNQASRQAERNECEWIE